MSLMEDSGVYSLGEPWHTGVAPYEIDHKDRVYRMNGNRVSDTSIGRVIGCINVNRVGVFSDFPQNSDGEWIAPASAVAKLVNSKITTYSHLVVRPKASKGKTGGEKD